MTRQVECRGSIAPYNRHKLTIAIYRISWRCHTSTCRIHGRYDSKYHSQCQRPRYALSLPLCPPLLITDSIQKTRPFQKLSFVHVQCAKTISYACQNRSVKREDCVKKGGGLWECQRIVKVESEEHNVTDKQSYGRLVHVQTILQVLGERVFRSLPYFF